MTPAMLELARYEYDMSQTYPPYIPGAELFDDYPWLTAAGWVLYLWSTLWSCTGPLTTTPPDEHQYAWTEDERLAYLLTYPEFLAGGHRLHKLHLSGVEYGTQTEEEYSDNDSR